MAVEINQGSYDVKKDETDAKIAEQLVLTSSSTNKTQNNWEICSWNKRLAENSGTQCKNTEKHETLYVSKRKYRVLTIKALTSTSK